VPRYGSFLPDLRDMWSESSRSATKDAVLSNYNSDDDLAWLIDNARTIFPPDGNVKNYFQEIRQAEVWNGRVAKLSFAQD
jgi:hypothetical protein